MTDPRMTKQSCWWFLEESRRLDVLLSTPSVPNEVKFFEMGKFIRYANSFATDVEQVLPPPEPEITAGQTYSDYHQTFIPVPNPN